MKLTSEPDLDTIKTNQHVQTHRQRLAHNGLIVPSGNDQLKCKNQHK